MSFFLLKCPSQLSLSRKKALKRINFLFKQLKCCGVDSYIDWSQTSWTNSSREVVPKSCCRKETENRGCQNGNPFNVENIHTKGCFKKALEMLTDNLEAVALGLLAIAVFQVK